MNAHLLYEDVYRVEDNLPMPGTLPEGTWVYLDTGRSTTTWAYTYMREEEILPNMLLWKVVPVDQVPKEIRTKLLLLRG